MFIAQIVAASARTLSGARARWVGCRPEPVQRVYFANHTSHLDAIVLWSLLPPPLRARTRMVAARDYWTAGPVRRYLVSRAFRAVLVDRTLSSFHRHPLGELFEAVDAGDSLILFPEGGRRTSPEVGEFRVGLFRLASRYPSLELVPVYLRFFDRVLPRGSRVPVPLLTDVVFGTPLPHVAGETREAFLARARAAIVGMAER